MSRLLAAALCLWSASAVAQPYPGPPPIYAPRPLFGPPAHRCEVVVGAQRIICPLPERRPIGAPCRCPLPAGQAIR